MKAPWANKTGLAKSVAVVATILLLALGLCGAQFALFAHQNSDTYLTFYIVTGSIELVTIGLCILLLLVFAVVWMVREVGGKRR